jgi:hypothetical protein
VTAPQPVVAMAAFRARYNEQGLFLVTATGPLKDVSFSPGVTPPNPVIVPHLVDGGGFATQIIVINGTSGAGASARSGISIRQEIRSILGSLPQ